SSWRRAGRSSDASPTCRSTPRTTSSSSTRAFRCRSSRPASARSTWQAAVSLSHRASPTMANLRRPPLQLDVFTLVPHAFAWMTEQRPLAAVLGTELELRLFNYRDTTPLTAGQVDDSPYGGGAGMVLRVDVVDAALQATYGEGPRPRTVLLSPTGPLLDDPIADELVAEPHVALLCGRYEGFDDRVHRHLADDEISIGRYVLAGGELPAMVVADVLMRKLPGALGHED